ncbi:hypothetical protein DFH07DRAFT_771230 [Mycena maculata]|uniref:F-box domain-containing protein n=1 Tax=Mycena maculata TaxID=230809 RepID=A0AAD7NI91_9AGAR|nr:hypothetical protein DFH07DRAFT_771230 [Mycena maculata]
MCDALWSTDVTVTIRNAPLLREVTLTEHPSLTVDMAWEQLTTLSITSHEAEEGLSTLQQCSNLLELDCSLRDTGRSPLAIPPFALPSLRHLRTGGRSILPFLTVPSLTHLDIWGPGFSGEMNELTQSLHALLERSVCPLNQLSFRVPPTGMSAAEFHSFLAETPSVVDLQLTFHASLDLITILQADGVLPRLETLRVLYATGHAPEDEVLTELLATLRSRREIIEGRATLDAFHLLRPKPNRTALPDAVKDELSALENGGMCISIDSKLDFFA